MSKRAIVDEIHRSARKNFPRRSVIIRGFDDLWQADLAEFIPYSKYNRGYKYILLVIDCYSKFLWTYPLKSKTGIEVSVAMSSILMNKRKPKNLQTDEGKEFYNKHFTQVMKSNNINHYSTYSIKKASIVERVIRTFKNILYKEFSYRAKYKWVDILASVTDDYNHRKHRTIKMRPCDVKSSIKLNVYNINKKIGKIKFKNGDFVRISKYKSVFDKGYNANWSAELFKIVRVNLGSPITYNIEDLSGNPIKGMFYTEELQTTAYPDTFLIEKVLRKRGNHLYVKWMGYQKPSWISKDSIQ